jgi:hypothetical protein
MPSKPYIYIISRSTFEKYKHVFDLEESAESLAGEAKLLIHLMDTMSRGSLGGFTKVASFHGVPIYLHEEVPDDIVWAGRPKKCKKKKK